jgi:hypothetical protein
MSRVPPARIGAAREGRARNGRGSFAKLYEALTSVSARRDAARRCGRATVVVGYPRRM